MAFSGLAFGLPFTMNSVEGTEASLFVAAAASRATWRKAMVALGAAFVTLVPFAVILWAAFHFVGAEYLDYTIAFLVFGLGAREVKEGLSERPRGGGRVDPGQVEAIGLGPASAASIRDFQKRHRLPVTGAIDERTRTAIRTARMEHGYEEADRYLFGVDVAAVGQVRAFQERHGLPATGEVDAPTRGALRVAQQQGFLDALDVEAIRRFQRENRLPATGSVDEGTAVALGTVRGEGATRVGGKGEGGQRVDPSVAWRRLDPADPASIRALQRSLGLATSGRVDEETRGALLALRARLHPDPADPGTVRDVQRRHGLPTSGVIDEATREAIRAELPEILEPRGQGAVPDPVDSEAVRHFQRLYGLDGTGLVDTPTQQAIRYTRDYFCEVDPVDEASVRRFQAAHGLAADGIIGPRTQTALLTVRTERMPAQDKERKSRYGQVVAGDGVGPRLAVDVANPDAVRAFQRQHHLTSDGTVGPLTREALAVARHQRLNGGARLAAHDRKQERGPIGRLRRAMGDAWPAYVGVMLETSEALLYSFAVTSSSFSFTPAIIGAGIGFSWPWALLPLIRKLTNRVAEWKQETGIGLILVSVAAAFGLLHMVGVFH